MGNQDNPFLSFSAEKYLMPQEEMLMKKVEKNKFVIGVPKETTFQEKRVSLVPSAAGLLVDNGHRVLIERGAGCNANFEDILYAENGVELCDGNSKIYQADIVIKVAPPTLEEIELMKE